MKKRIIGSMLIVLLMMAVFMPSCQGIMAMEMTETISSKNEENSYDISNIVNVDKKQISKTLAEEWVKNDGEFEYPINPGTDDWGEIDTHEEMVEVCTIPDEIVKRMSTKELLKIVLDYPLLVDMYYYNTYEQGLYNLVLQFNGLRELLKREDATSEIIKCYQEYKIPEATISSEKILKELDNTEVEEYDEILTETLKNAKKGNILHSNFKYTSNIEFLETLLVNDIILDSCTGEQKQKIVDISCKKYDSKTKSNLFVERAGFVYEAAQETGNLNIFEKNNFMLMGNVTYVTTPNGSKVPVYTSTYNGAEWAAKVDAETKRDYPNAKILRSSDNRYNCHSYAWCNQTELNIYWMNDPSAYINDGSYKKVTDKSKRSAKNRILWVQAPLANPYVHSGYLAKINSDGTYTVYSKWGSGPLMSHKAKYSPYSGTRQYYKR